MENKRQNIFCQSRFEDLIDLEYLLKMQDAFTNLTHCVMTIIDMDGNHIVKGEHSHELCRMIKRSPIGSKRCQQSDKQLIQDVAETHKFISRPCKSVGLTDIAIPIMVHNFQVGTIILGQVNAHNLLEKDVRKYAKEIGLSEDELVEAYKKVPVMDDIFFSKAVNLLEVFTNELSNMLTRSCDLKQQLAINEENMKVMQRDYDVQLMFNHVLQDLFVNKNEKDILGQIIKYVRQFFVVDYLDLFQKGSEGSEVYYEATNYSQYIDRKDYKSIRMWHNEIKSGIETMKKDGQYTSTINDFPTFKDLDVAKTGLIEVNAFPIYIDGEISGFLVLASKKPSEWSLFEFNTLKNIAYVIGSYMENMISDKRIKEMAFTDSLLGIPNRLACEKYLNDCLNKSEQLGTKGAVLFIDLDHFKAINDMYGHSYGDLLLSQIILFFGEVEEIKNSYYRFGGDEFIIILDDVSEQEVKKVKNIILERFRHTWLLNGTKNICTASIGIAFYPEHGTTTEEIIRNADVAMYRVKASGKDSGKIFDSSIDVTLTGSPLNNKTNKSTPNT